MADGFDECHKKGLSASPVCATPLLTRMKELLRREGGSVCFFEYLHPSDPDVNHVDLLTPLLIVYCFSLDFFFSLFLIVLFLSLCRRVPLLQVHVCLPTWDCVFQCMFILTGCCPSSRTNANLINWP